MFVRDHQDGSCNGLQHYAALGRDARGGAAVNLTPSEKPQDVYTDVLKTVSAWLQLDAAVAVEGARACYFPARQDEWVVLLLHSTR